MMCKKHFSSYSPIALLFASLLAIHKKVRSFPKDLIILLGDGLAIHQGDACQGRDSRYLPIFGPNLDPPGEWQPSPLSPHKTYFPPS